MKEVVMKLLDYEKQHLSRVRAGLSECMVLLRKNGAFPLDKAEAIAAYGCGVRHSVKGGTGSGDVNVRFTVSIEQGLAEAGFDIVSGDWLDAYDKCRETAKKAFRRQIRKEARAAGQDVITFAMGAVMPEPEYQIPLTGSADAAIYVVSRISGEGNDRKAEAGDVMLTASEIRDILALDRNYDRFMLVLNTGGPVDLTPVSDVGNILVLSQLGAETGRALADVLLGRAVPSGKLATTWTSFGDYCEMDFGFYDDTEYREGIYVGYRYFDTVGKKALFPFGYGLSYTDFTLGCTTADIDGRTVSVRTEVTNTGGFNGKEVVQLYVTAPEVKLKKPWQELAGFAKTRLLAPDETETVTIEFDLSDITSFDEERHVYCLEAGEYILRIGVSSTETVPAAVISLSDEIITAQAKPIVAKPDMAETVFDRVYQTEKTDHLPRLTPDPESFGTERAVPETEEEIPSLCDEELAYLAVGHFSEKGGLLSIIGNASPHSAGAAGETTSKLADKGIRPVIMADGPAGLRLAKEYYEDKKGIHTLGNGFLPEGMLDVLSAPVRLAAKALTKGPKPPKKAVIKTQYCTSLPIGTALAQSWNIEYASVLGDIVGSEMERFGIDLWLAPALNIHRSILCGRNFEYYSEDPLLSGKIAAAVTRGVQSHPGRGTTIKHFAANNQETNRYYNNSCVSERALREIYLKGFALCIREADPLALMTSYNLVNGTHTSESRGLIEGFLRTECGYKGLVITDWVLGIKNLSDKYPITRADRVSAAGGNLFMPGRKTDYQHVLSALKEGRISRAKLEKSAARVIKASRHR